ncbi:MAG TPA: PIN domain-containing protein [Phycisphaerae bacterium]|jgi:predicted nucleic acid-binding protein|nr:PIN domain-containing protein [Phycisphaerae bacterium]HRR85455.1 PIN domain-containing protein [Phycisphaerae bacterium]
MSVVVDASVFVAASRPSEAHYRESVEFLVMLRREAETICCPVLVLAECSGAIARMTQSSALAGRIVRLIEGIENLQMIPLTLALAKQAAQLAGDHRLRGADAVYVAAASELKAALVTWDDEMLQRSPRTVSAITPAQWIRKA